MRNVNHLKDAVWELAKTIPGKDPYLYRQDAYENVMYRWSYGKDTPMGWVIDHIKPVSKGGTDDLDNLQAMNTAKNRELGDSTDKRSRHSQENQGFGALVGVAVGAWLGGLILSAVFGRSPAR